MKTLSHIPQQPDITDEFVGVETPVSPDMRTTETKWVMKREGDAFIFRGAPEYHFGLSGYHKRKDELVNSAIKYGYTVLSFDSQAGLDAWLKEGK